MMHYSIQPRDRILKGYAFLYFAENMGKRIGRNTSKNLSSKYSQKLLDHAKQSATDVLKTAPKRTIPKTAGATDDFVSNKITDMIKKVLETSPQNNSETVTNERDKEIPKERHISKKKDRKFLMI